MKLTRRTAIAGIALAPWAASYAAAQDLRVVVHVDGDRFTFDAAGAEDLGTFSSPAGFRQACFRSVHGRLPLTVFFRPDIGSDRLEVVFELGRLWSGAPEPLRGYRVEIQRAGTTLATLHIPRHFWFSRWRWQSAPRPVKANLAELRARGLIPPYANRDFPFEAPPPPKAARYATMDLAGITPKMHTTGERDEIGLVTEHQARFICTGNAEALASARAQAEAAGTLPWHLRDEETGAPVDLDRHSAMSWYGDPRVGEPHIPLGRSGIAIDAAHQPALAYLPYLLTGDPYHLEDLQFAANYNRGALPPPYRLSIPQTRAFAWSLRTLSQAANVTPTEAPRWLLPAGYFRDDLDRTRRWFETTYVRSDQPLHRVFRATDNPDTSRDEPQAPAGTWVSPWQDEFLVAALGWTVLMGFEEWRPNFDWKLGGTLARTSAHAGWSRSRPSPYRLIVKPEKAGNIVGSWEEAWRLSSGRAGWKTHETGTLADDDLTYAIYTRGALAIAVHLGVKDAEAPLRWITQQLRTRDAAIPYKWRLA